MGDDPMTTRGWLSLGVFLIGSLAVAGCENWPWSTTSNSSPGTSSASSATPAGAPQPAPLLSLPQPIVPPTEVIAKVNGKVIGKHDVELALQDMRSTIEALGQPWTSLSAKDEPNQYDLVDLINDLTTAELRAQDVLARGLDRNTDVQQRFRHRFRNFFAQEWVNWQLNRVTVEQTEIDQFYKQNQWGFREPEQIRLRQLVLSSEDQAKAVLVKLLEGVDFLTVAQQSSLRPEAAQGPLVEQWVMRSGEKAAFAPTETSVRDLKEPVLEQAAFAIDQVGGVSSYVKGADGNYHVFQLVERKAGRQKPLLEVADNIRNFLRLQKLSQLTEELRTKAQIERFPERLADVQQ